VLADIELVLVRRYAVALPTLHSALVGGRKREWLAVVCPTPSLPLSPSEGEDCLSACLSSLSSSSQRHSVRFNHAKWLVVSASHGNFYLVLQSVLFNVYLDKQNTIA